MCFRNFLRRNFFSAAPRCRSTGRIAPVSPLEDRTLLTADLVISSVSAHFDASPTIPSQYTATLQVTIENEGTTGINLTGQHFDLGDNVRIKAVFTNSTSNFDYVESNPTLAEGIVSGPSADSVTIVLAPGAERTVQIKGTFSANSSFLAYRVKVDNTNIISESDEANNVFNTTYSLFDPIVSLSRTQLNLAAGQSALVDPEGSVVDTNSSQLGGSVLELTVAHFKPGDTLSVRKSELNGLTLARKGSNIKLGHQIVATVTGGKQGEPLKFNFTGAADSSIITTLFQHTLFKSNKSQPGTRFIDILFKDPDAHVGSNSVELDVA